MNTLEKYPEFVITTRSSFSPEWQTWSVSANYWFYQVLFENYEPVIASPTTLIWHRLSSKVVMPVASCLLNKEKNAFVVDVIQPGYYEIDLNLSFKGDVRTLLLVENKINIADKSIGYVSINPHAETHIFPVMANQTGRNNFEFKVISKDSATNTLSLIKCSARHIVLTYTDVFPSSS